MIDTLDKWKTVLPDHLEQTHHHREDCDSLAYLSKHMKNHRKDYWHIFCIYDVSDTAYLKGCPKQKTEKLNKFIYSSCLCISGSMMLPKMLVQCFREMRKVRTSFAIFGAGPRHSQIYCSEIENVDSEWNQTWKPLVTAHVESCRRRPWYVWRPNQAGIPALEAEVLTWDHYRSW